MSSIADHMPRIRRTQPKHRAIDRVGYLEHQVDALEDLAGRQAAQLDELGRAHLALRELFDQAGIDLSGALDDARVANERAAEAERLRDAEHAELTALRARVANLDPWRIPQVGARDIDPDGQATHPIDVRALRAEHAEPWRSPVVHLNQAPFAAPTPADADPRSLNHRFMAGETRVTVTGGPFAKATA